MGKASEMTECGELKVEKRERKPVGLLFLTDKIGILNTLCMQM